MAAAQVLPAGTQEQFQDCARQSGQMWTYTAGKQLQGPGNMCLDANGAGTSSGTYGTDPAVLRHRRTIARRAGARVDAHHSPVTTAETYWTVFEQTAKVAVTASARLLLSHARIRMSLEAASQA